MRIIVAWLAITAPAMSLTAEDGEPQAIDRASIEEQIEALGSDAWEDRQAATTAILEIGIPAVPSLKILRNSSDPEVRSRVEWLLSILEPPFFQVEVVRVSGKRTLTERGLRPVEWGRVAFPARESGETETFLPGGIGRRLEIRVEGESPPYRLEIDVSTQGAPLELSGRVQLDTVTRIEREEAFTVENSIGPAAITRTPAAWIVRVVRTDGPPPPSEFETPDDIATWLERGVTTALESTRPDSVRLGAEVASTLGRLDLMPPHDEVSRKIRLEIAIQRFLAGDLTLEHELTEMLTSHLEGSALLELDVADELAFALAERGSSLAVGSLLGRMTEAPLWRQHMTAGVLRELIRDPAFLEREGARILDTLLDRAGIGNIHYEDGVIVALLRDLERRLPAEEFSERFIRDLDLILSEPMGSGANRMQAMVRVLHTTLSRHPVPTERWLKPVIELLVSPSVTDAALAFLIDRRARGDLDEEQWREVWMTLAERLSLTDAGALYKARSSLTRILALPDLPASERRAIMIEQLRCYSIDGQNLRSSIDNELSKEFGRLDLKQPAKDDTQGWAARGELWRKKLEALPEEDFAFPEPDFTTELRLTMADFRILPAGQGVELIDCRSFDLHPGSSHIEIGADLGNQSILIESYGSQRTGMYRMVPGSILNVDRPVARRMQPTWRYFSRIVSESRIGLVHSSLTGMVTFDSLILLEEIADHDPEEGAPRLDPALIPEPDDSPAECYEKLCRRLLAKLPEADARLRSEYLKMIGRFQIAQARAPIATLYEEKPDAELARALLGLGDARGEQLLLDSIRAGDRKSAEILVDLLSAGVAGAIEPAMEWIEAAHPRAGSPYTLIRALDAAFSDPRFVDQLEEERFLGVMVGALDSRSVQPLAVQILRKRTGLEFGYYDASQLKDNTERLEAQNACYDEWRRWWADRVAAAESKEK